MKPQSLLPITATLGGLSLLARRYYWRDWLPDHRFKQLQHQMQARGKLTGGWIDHRPVAVARGDVLATGYVGGLVLDERAYAFTLAADGTLLRWDAI